LERIEVGGLFLTVITVVYASNVLHEPAKWITLFSFTHPSDRVLFLVDVGTMYVKGLQAGSLFAADTFKTV